jgi:hypothetical protein
MTANGQVGQRNLPANLRSRRLSRDNKGTRPAPIAQHDRLAIGELTGKIIVFLLINGHCIQRISLPTRRPLILSSHPFFYSPYPFCTLEIFESIPSRYINNS